MRRGNGVVGIAAATVTAAVSLPSPAGASAGASFNAVTEARNYSITLQRQAEYDTPAYQSKLLQIGTRNAANAIRTQLRGPDLTDWYTTAWFDKYVKGDPSADARLLSTRWQHDATAAAVDPGHDGNAFSFYYRSRLDVHRSGGGAFDCEDLRAGCAGMSSADGRPPNYSYLSIDTSPDVP